MSTQFDNQLTRLVDWAKDLDPEAAFRRLADVLNGEHFGVEHCSVPNQSNEARCEYEMEYLNTGDTYSTTIVRDVDKGLMVTSWGDWFEGAENAYHKEHGTIGCGYCGYYTPKNKGEWSDVVCESCEHNVGG